MSNSPRFSPTRRDSLAVIILVLAAMLLRVVVVFDRSAADPAFKPLPMGSDQRTYVTQAELYEAGKWPTEPFRYQPGLAYYFIGIRALVGKSLGVMRLATSLTGALTCGLMVGIGWLLTGRRWGGYLAGFLLAIYPVAIFYSTVLLIPGLASFYVALFL
ncbi:MAG: hypothetical protein K8I60_08875, partial [Anaerolineae bacterium]|nr:hypothetical protein [Anaerolineae bacterium]